MVSRKIQKIGFICFSLLGAFTLFLSCNTDPKILSSEEEEISTDEIDTSETLVVRFALRDTANEGTDSRTVKIQGVSNTVSAAVFSNTCGEDGSQCECLFSANNTDNDFQLSASLSLNTTLNFITCNVRADLSPGSFNFVRIRTKDLSKKTGFIPIETSLTLTEILDDLDKSKVRKIFEYTCTRFFFEGSALTTNDSLAGSLCSDTATLSEIRADFHFYLFQDQNSSNFQERLSDEIVYTVGSTENIFCGRRVTRLQCSSTEELKFGLYAESAGPFIRGVILSSGPGLAPNASDSVQGFAANTDENFNCPPGLIKIRPYEIVPPSRTGTVQNNFRNIEGSLNDFLLRDITNDAPTSDTFTISVTAAGNSTCNSGTCTAPDGAITTSTVTATPIPPVLCALPKNLVSDL